MQTGLAHFRCLFRCLQDEIFIALIPLRRKRLKGSYFGTNSKPYTSINQSIDHINSIELTIGGGASSIS